MNHPCLHGMFQDPEITVKQLFEDISAHLSLLELYKICNKKLDHGFVPTLPSFKQF